MTTFVGLLGLPDPHSVACVATQRPIISQLIYHI